MRSGTKIRLQKNNPLWFGSKLHFVFILLLFSGIADFSFACRYNVRETGFIYLAQKPYQLVVFYSDEVSGNDISTIQQLAKNHLSDSNIEPVYLNINSGTDFAELRALQKKESILLPWVLLKSADGQILKFPLNKKGISLEESVDKVFRNISFSKVRDEVIQKCISNYGVVLILEGTNTEANAEAHKTAQLAISHVESKMSLMPKKINAPPAIVSVKHTNTDEILNWSLGLETGTFEKPKVFVIYGRGRWIGPVLEGDLISKKNLSELLIIVGADCECGIDREWMRGTMIPVKWDKKDRQKVAENLEFDPENPLIKKEVRNILRMGEIFGNIPQNDSVLNFSEFIDVDNNEQNIQAKQSNSNHNSKYLLLVISLIVILVFIVAFFLFWRMRK